MKKFFLVIVSLLTCFGYLVADQYFAPTNLLKFGDYLFERGEYEFAIGEFQRFLFMSRFSTSVTGEVLLKVGISYSKLGRYDRAKRYFKIVLKNKNFPAVLRSKAAYDLAYLAVQEHNFTRAAKISNSYGSNVTIPEVRSKLKLIESLSSLYQGQLKEAELSSSSLSGTKYYSDLKSLIEMGKNMKSKSPILAALLSALIPGLGKVYCERTKDGIVSFFVVGMVSGLTYYFYRERGITPEVVILGTLDAGYYLGNIYGSAMAARVYNYEQHQDFLRALDQKAGIWFEYSY